MVGREGRVVSLLGLEESSLLGKDHSDDGRDEEEGVVVVRL